MAAESRKTVAEMFGEFLREAAVLTAVFIPMDWILVEKNAISWAFASATVGVSAGLLAAGVIIDETEGGARERLMYRPLIMLALLGSVVFVIGMFFALLERRQHRRRLENDRSRGAQAQIPTGASGPSLRAVSKLQLASFADYK